MKVNFTDRDLLMFATAAAAAMCSKSERPATYTVFKGRSLGPTELSLPPADFSTMSRQRRRYEARKAEARPTRAPSEGNKHSQANVGQGKNHRRSASGASKNNA